FLVIRLDMKYGKFKMRIFETMQYYKRSTAKYFLVTIFLCSSGWIYAQSVLTGADQMDSYLHRLHNKKVGLFVNHTSIVGQTHLSDSLLTLGINITTVFSPEHGIKGNKPDGEKIINEESEAYELISLYGQSKRPDTSRLSQLDILVVDIQDVGVRCYTYVSTLTYLMEGCALVGTPVLLLDRPNPNAYVDGPILEERFESFIGLHPVPLVHGLTLGEYASMINGEGWLDGGLHCKLDIIPVKNWDHSLPYSVPVPPSPNLPNDLSIALYPSLVLFEGTIASIGRGTSYPFQVIGHPDFTGGTFSFTPQPNEGSKYPPLENTQCFGIGLLNQEPKYQLNISFLIDFYNNLKLTSEPFFDSDRFILRAGTDQLQMQIESGLSEAEIRASWQQDLNEFLKLRQKYVLYEN
ncbi:MAG: DUF1343 domain-containing protein, partial [Marinoscillum sp.]